MKHASIVLCIAAVVALALGGAAFAQDGGALSGTQWHLVSIGEVGVVEDTTVTLAFGEDGRASGSSGCNMFATAYTIAGDALSFGPVLSTRMACPDAASREQEAAYFAALEAAVAFLLADQQLTILYSEGEQMVFESQAVLANTQWNLVTLGGADAAGDTWPTLMFSADGQASGNTGCNIFRTTYTSEGDALSFDERIITTRRACASAVVSAQEQAYLAALASAATYAFVDDQLTILYGDGEALAFVRQFSLAGTTWQLDMLDDAAVIAGSAITLTFDDEGRVSGSGGCNTYSGSYVVDGEALMLSQIASTLRACQDAGVGEQEQAYFAALDGATGYVLTGDTLTITYGEGGQLRFSPLAN
ncbi:MAG: META domain-containing protein [Anaerolineae bacterium]|nr:META domain-containing protein [Anaerolineae bacterium]